jgi:hypothetical protein
MSSAEAFLVFLDEAFSITRCTRPVGIDQMRWAEYRADALGVTDRGQPDWMRCAAELGWSAAELLGPAGLAWRLRGRRLVELTGDYAVAADATGARELFDRRLFKQPNAEAGQTQGTDRLTLGTVRRSTIFSGWHL